MTAVVPPHFDRRRRKELRTELLARARMWLPDWQPGGSGTDVMAAVLEISARLDAEVTQRLDRVPEKSFRGFLHWLGRRGRSGEVARMPVVFSMSARAEPVLAPASVQLQADAGGTPVIFETERPVRLIPSLLDSVVASKGADRFYVAFPGLANLEAPEPAPTAWRLVTPASYGMKQVQLDPPEGLSANMVLADDMGRKYRVEAAKNGLVTFAEALGSSPETAAPSAGLYTGGFSKVSSFAPFDGQERDRQVHALYIGAKEKLDIETAATIWLDGDLPANCDWSYWGKNGNSESGWQKLEQDPKPPFLLSKQTKGAIEEYEINGASLRWLRAVPKDPKNVTRQAANNIKIAINCNGGHDAAAESNDKGGKGNAADGSGKPGPSDKTPAKPDTFINLEAVANTTPVVLTPGFFPFGREPRQFDACYLSGPEAFGKPNAFATIDITLADGFNGPLNAAATVTAALVAGVGDDLGLRMVYVESGSGDAKVRFLPSTRPDSGPGGQPVRFGAQKVGVAFSSATGVAQFSATDGSDCWVWKAALSISDLPETLDGNLGEWKSYGRPALPDEPIAETLLLLREGAPILYALFGNGELHRRALAEGASWERMPGIDKDQEPRFKRVVPFERGDRNPGETPEEGGLAGFSQSGELWYCEAPERPWRMVDHFMPVTQIGAAAYPLALFDGSKRAILAPALRTEGQVLTIEEIKLRSGDEAEDVLRIIPLKGTLFGDALCCVFRTSRRPTVLCAIDKDGRRSLVSWKLFVDSEPSDIDLPVTPHGIVQPPVRLANGYVLPLEHGAIATFGFESEPVTRQTVGEMRSIALWKGRPLPAPDDTRQVLEMPDFSPANFFFFTRVTDTSNTDRGLEMRILRKGIQNGVNGRIHDLGGDLKGTVQSKETIELDRSDQVTVKDTVLCVCLGQDPDSDPAKTLYTVTDVTVTNAGQANEKKVATVRPDFGPPRGKRAYFPVVATSDMVSFDTRPTVLIGQSVEPPPDPDSTTIEFEGSDLDVKLEVAPFSQGNGARLILKNSWIGAAPGEGTKVSFLQQASLGTVASPPAPRNPELSWEYWNGSGWWQISSLTDGTQNFVKSGLVQFCVPADLQPSDVTGRSGSWIRARLVGGDYGQETVKVITTRNRNESIQTVVRDPSTIRAPFIVSVTVTYELCCAVAPDRILTLDSGTFRDQTEINLAVNANLEVFTTLAQSLGQAQVSEPAAPAGKGCQCADAAQGTDSTEGGQHDKAIYLGFSEPLEGQGISILFTVEENGQDSVPRLDVEAFTNGAFRRVEATDETRALSETGIITLALPRPLQRVSLFGKSLHWLRLAPVAGTQTPWAPTITGIHLNSVWTSAGETHQNEVVGRSDGSPGQTFRLAHKAVVDGTLELRIREPLGEEDIEDLDKLDAANVLPKIGLWPGPWILWRRGDLATAKPGERVFDFDSALGVITFGDGRRGAIPPIGADNIVGVVYRSGATADGNRVGAWNKPNLISPLRGVQSVTTPEGAAGGSDAQEVAQALLYASSNIAMRDRAVTLADYERLAVQSSPDIVQARAIAGSRGVAVIAVRRGRDPRPDAAMRRALEQFLRARAAPSFGRADSLSVEAPVSVPISIAIVLTVSDFALAGPIAEDVKTALMTLLDTATGGFDQSGWPLGTMLSQVDVSAAISEVENILEVRSITIAHVGDGPLAVSPRHLVTLAEGDLQLTCLQPDGERV